MTKRRIVVLAIVALMLMTPLLAAAAAITWKDDNLEVAVRDALVLDEKKPVSEQDMRLLKSLNALVDPGTSKWQMKDLDSDWDDTEVIRNLHGLQFATNLKKLGLAGNFIGDLAPIADLDLEYLDLRDNNNDFYVETVTPKPQAKDGFSYNPSNPQMVILNDLQERGAVVLHSGVVKRISGADRYNTAVRIWQNWTYQNATFEKDNDPSHDFKIADAQKAGGIFLARGDDYADALCGVPLAYKNDMPILLTQSNSLNADLKKQITAYVKESKVTSFDIRVLGGEAAVSPAVVNEIIYHLETEFAGLDVKQYRYGGADRFATSVAIAKELIGKAINIGDNDDIINVIFTNGRNFPDALTAAPYAAMSYDGDNKTVTPILLVEPDSVPAVIKTYLTTNYNIDDKTWGIGNIADTAVVAGGPAAVSEKVVSDLYALRCRYDSKDNKVFSDTKKDILRVWGADRYETAAELATHYAYMLKKVDDDDDGEVLGYYIATGENFADALTGAWLAAKDQTGVLLVKPNSVPTKIADKVKAIAKAGGAAEEEGTDITIYPYLTILGGENAVTRHNAVLLYNLAR